MATILITGANRGIGLELARQYDAEGHEVIRAMRGVDKADPLFGTTVALDVTDDESVMKMAAGLDDKPIDLLIANAGVIGPERQSSTDMDFQGFLDTLDADAVIADLALLDQPIETFEHFRMVIEIRRRAMQLDQIQAVGLQVLEASVDPAVQVFCAIPLDGLLRQAATRLAGDKWTLPAPFLHHFRNEAFGMAVAIDIGGVDKGDARVERGMEGRKRLFVIHLPPCCADRPCAEADLTDLAAGLAELSRLHISLPR